MNKKTQGTQRRDESLSRERIIEAAIEILDSTGESGLTFRSLSEKLATGPGAIYWHIADKSDLLTAACDAIVARTVDAQARDTTPKSGIRKLALGIFDMMEAHPWAGSALIRAGGKMPIVRILERVGPHVDALGVPKSKQWATVSALLNYMLGVGAQNAANTLLARSGEVRRSELLDGVSAAWSQLDPANYPYTRSMASYLLAHDDRKDFLAGIDLILSGIDSGRNTN
ncbi:TetR/AcrR family transcriptional regulator [Herminiimonas glaciei]|uniref:TetR/AcrR family transcriptional regulator n=1 Tax=Herminiimonas glaciei TaxID=523788 RepID=A0ABW2I8I2_9BURK